MKVEAMLRQIENGRTDLVHVLLASTEVRSVCEKHGTELLRWSSYFGDATACRLLLAQGQLLTALGDDLGLNAAAFHGHWQLCQLLLEHGAPVDHADPQTGETPLHSALTSRDRVRYDLVVQVLLAAGADPNATTKPDVGTGSLMRDSRTKGETPLHRAALFGDPSTLAQLIQAGASLDRLDVRGDSPLAWASWARRPVSVLRLLLYGSHRIHPEYTPIAKSVLGRPMNNRMD